MLMSGGSRRSVVDTCLGLFISAVLVYVAVQLVLSVLVPLLIITGLALAIGLAVRLVRGRRQGW